MHATNDACQAFWTETPRLLFLTCCLTGGLQGICFDYLRNQCQRGLLCRFSHDLSNIAQQCQVCWQRGLGQGRRVRQRI